MHTEVLGFIAGSLVAGSLVPQVIKSIKTKSTSDISLQWSLINLGGQFLWIVYGIAIKSTSLYVTSCVTSAMALTILILKLRYGMTRRPSVSSKSRASRSH